ncbi:MAG TPA: phospholipase D-like domain-containing protein [Longimicrobiales bacterium]
MRRARGPGGRPAHRRPAIGAAVQRGLRRAAEAPLVHGNSGTLLIDGPRAYPAMLERIAGAERRVHFENYIFRGDAVGRRFADALIERARAGVEVRVLYDWFGSVGTARSFWSRLRRAGCEVRAFGPPSLRRPHAMLRRDHRKLVVVDGRCAVIGGLCIGREWEGGDGAACWRDTAVLLEGPVARELDRAFTRMWRRAGGGRPPPLDIPAPIAGDVAVRVVDGPPAHARAYRLYQLLAAMAERALYVTGAYPLAPGSLRRALGAAARAGVDVRLLVPGRSDLPLLTQAGRAHYAALLRAGVRIYEWQGPMLHAKTVVADGSLALVGSSNLNPFSFTGNYELDVEIQDAAIAAALERQFMDDLEAAREIALDEWCARPAAQRWRERLGALALWLPYRLYGG